MAQLWLARRYGATTHTNEKVLQFEPSGGGVRVTTDKRGYRAGRLIITAGSWLPELVPDAAHHFKVQRQVRAPILPGVVRKLRARRGLSLY